MENRPGKRIHTLGGGFAGLTVAMDLEKKLARDPSVEVTLVNREKPLPVHAYASRGRGQRPRSHNDCEFCPQDAAPLIPDLSTGSFCPPTAQHAVRQGRVVAKNVIAHAEGGICRQFNFKTIGLLASIRHRAGVASPYGREYLRTFCLVDVAHHLSEQVATVREGTPAWRSTGHSIFYFRKISASLSMFDRSTV